MNAEYLLHDQSQNIKQNKIENHSSQYLVWAGHCLDTGCTRLIDVLPVLLWGRHKLLAICWTRSASGYKLSQLIPEMLNWRQISQKGRTTLLFCSRKAVVTQAVWGRALSCYRIRISGWSLWTRVRYCWFLDNLGPVSFLMFAYSSLLCAFYRQHEFPD